MFTLALTPAQWLPKPATRWMPQISCSLRETWSPGERENHSQVQAKFDVTSSRPKLFQKLFGSCHYFAPQPRMNPTHCATSGTELSQFASYSMEMLPLKPCAFNSSRMPLMSETPVP